jgi:hypothetical protein
LTEAAAKVATDGGDRIRKGSRQKMKQGFFFDGINVPGDELAIDQGIENTTLIFSYAANAPSAAFNHTTMTAKIAFDIVVFKGFI